MSSKNESSSSNSNFLGVRCPQEVVDTIKARAKEKRMSISSLCAVSLYYIFIERPELVDMILEEHPTIQKWQRRY